MARQPRCLIVFAKEPAARAKTRLTGTLHATDRVALYRAFLQDTYALAKKARCELKVVAFDSGRSYPYRLKKIFKEFVFYRQKGSNLGQRLLEAFRSFGGYRIVAIGSDAPTLSSEYIRCAFRALETHDAVLGPARDGGYYLIGLCQPCETVFKGVRWSTARAAADTIRLFKKAGKKYALLGQWYDVDDGESFEYLKRQLRKTRNRKGATHTRRFLNERGPSRGNRYRYSV